MRRVWAAGDAGALEAAVAGRARARGLRVDHIARARKVDKAKRSSSTRRCCSSTFNTGGPGGACGSRYTCLFVCAASFLSVVPLWC